jgi:hypothetical protein
VESTKQRAERLAQEAAQKNDFVVTWAKVSQWWLKRASRLDDESSLEEIAEVVEAWRWVCRVSHRLLGNHNAWVGAASGRLMSEPDLKKHFRELTLGAIWKNYARLYDKWRRAQPTYRAWKKRIDRAYYETVTKPRLLAEELDRLFADFVPLVPPPDRLGQSADALAASTPNR